jgi:protein-disulfide isomerase
MLKPFIGFLSVGLILLSGCTGSKSDPVVAEFNGVKVKASEAFTQVKTRLFDLEEEVYRTKEQAINDYVDQKILEMEAQKQKLSREELLEKEVGTVATKEVSEEEITEFLASKGLSLNDKRIKKEDVKEYLKFRQKFEKQQQYVTKLREAAKVKILVSEPEAPKLAVTTEGQPTWGSSKAPVTIVEFSDFQCPFCARAVPIIEKIKQEYGPEKVRLVFHHLPLPNHNRAVPASLAASCANEQGKFWEMHNMLFENQAKLEDADLKSYAKKLALDETKFSECYDKKAHMDRIEASKKEGEKAGISATPSFVINGVLIQGAQPFERFKEKIDRALKKG